METKQIKAITFSVDSELMEDVESLIPFLQEKVEEFKQEHHIGHFEKVGINFYNEADYYLNNKITVRLHYWYYI